MAKRKWTKEEIKTYRASHSSIFYYNKEDANFIVPKVYGFGWTVNLAHPLSWILGVIIITSIVMSKWVK